MNHGHVTPNPNGVKARCGGPAFCPKCAMEYAQLHNPVGNPPKELHQGGMRRFHLQRDTDATGVSGTGRVAEGVMFHDGQACLKWLTNVNSLAVYPSMNAVATIHGHDGKTRVVWDDPE